MHCCSEVHVLCALCTQGAMMHLGPCEGEQLADGDGEDDYDEGNDDGRDDDDDDDRKQQ